MNIELAQGYIPFAAAGLVLIAALVVLTTRRRRAAVVEQAQVETDYAIAVTGYRGAVEQLLARRSDLLAAISDIESGRGARDKDSLLALRQGVSDVDILLPEPPVPPTPVAGLSRGARRRAESWRIEREAELPELRRLADVTPAVSMPAQVKRTRKGLEALAS